MASQVDPDVVVLTEAKVPQGGPPQGWEAIWLPDGVGKRRRWGTVIAGRGVGLLEVTEVSKTFRTVPLRFEWPATVHVADVMVEGERWGTVVGLYGITLGPDGSSIGSGEYSVDILMDQLRPLFRSSRRDRIVVAGDFNLLPARMARTVAESGLIDLVAMTASDRPLLVGCTGCDLGDGCGHMWTHRNTDRPGAAVQHLDYLLATPELAREVTGVRGGVRDFPDAWEISDHAPVLADFG